MNAIADQNKVRERARMIWAAVVLVSLNQPLEQQKEDEPGKRVESDRDGSEAGGTCGGLQVKQGAAEQGSGRKRHERSDQTPRPWPRAGGGSASRSARGRSWPCPR